MRNKMEEKELLEEYCLGAKKERGRIRVKMWRGRVVKNVIGRI